MSFSNIDEYLFPTTLVSGKAVPYKGNCFEVLKPYRYTKTELRHVKATVGVKLESFYAGEGDLKEGSMVSLYELNTIAQDNDVPEYQKYVSLARGGNSPKYRWLEAFVERLIAEGTLAEPEVIA